MLTSGYDKYWEDWIVFNGTKCPCIGKYIQAHYGDGDIEEGIAIEHAYWAYVHAYRVRREVEDDGGMGYKEMDKEEAIT